MSEIKIVFDLETVAIPFAEFDTSQQEYLLRGATTEEEEQKKKNEMALSPLTSRIVCIGLKFMRTTDSAEQWETVKEIAYVQSVMPEQTEHETLLSSGAVVRYMDEAMMLTKFWEILDKSRDAELVSFNGRGFDAPFLMLRSALHRIRPSRNLMEGTKFNYPKHTDLIDELTFYMPSNSGATKRYNFDFYTRAFGIPSPKSEGVHGGMVGELFAEGKTDVIAEYCLRDVRATWELYRVWREYLSFKK